MNTNETRNVAASIQNTSASGRSKRSAKGSAATAANIAAPSGMVPYDDPRTRPFARGRSSSSTRSGIDESRAGRKTRLAASSRNAHEVDPPDRTDERHWRDDPGPQRVHREHRAAPIPMPARTRGERAADRGRQEAQREDPPDGERRVGELEGQRHEGDGAHPVAEPRDTLSDQEIAKATPSDERAEAHGGVGVSGSRSSSRRVHVRSPAGLARALVAEGALHEHRCGDRSTGERSFPAVGDREHGRQRDLADEATEARLVEHLADDHRPEEHDRARPRDRRAARPGRVPRPGPRARGGTATSCGR